MERGKSLTANTGFAQKLVRWRVRTDEAMPFS